jgi:nucleoside-diphosphate-sugar epimerase|tara:strand:+ start:3319 stop:4239 length:921 start_codon:yes stop_codon:yes gene_type:complete
MKYLITGGLGYLGIELAYHLSKNETNKIIIYDKAVYGVQYASYVLNRKNISLVVGDIRDEEKLAPLIKKVDTIIHLASLVGAPLVKKRPIESHETNILGTELVTKLIGENQKLLFASTGSTYGKVEDICTEETPISPLSAYGAHKARGEEIVSTKNALSMRFATVYGLSFRTRDDLYINNMVKKALVDRSVVLYEQFARRTFIHIHDIVRAVEYFSHDVNFQSGPLNIGDPNLALTKLDVCEKIASLTEFHIISNEYAEDMDQRDYEVSYEKMTSKGFECIMVFDDAMEGLLNYYQSLFQASYENG